MVRSVTILVLTIFSASAFAGRSVAIQDLQSDRRVIVQSTQDDSGLSKFTFYTCAGQGSISVAQIDLSQCQSFLDGKSLSLSQIVGAIMSDGARNPISFLATDSAYGVRSAKRQIEGQSFNTLNETTYMGSGQGYNFAQKPEWLLSTLDRAITGNSDVVGLKVGYSKSENYSNGFFEGSVEGLTALLLYAK